MNNIVSLSGGKDSTAMLHMMLDRGEEITDVVFFDTGWEFPQMLEHIDKIERQTGLSITRIQADPPFDYWLCERPVVARKGPNRGKVHRIGNGWPSSMRRWCTRQKVDAIAKYVRRYDAPIMSIGFAVDELHRVNRKSQAKRKYDRRYPLIEYNIDESTALKYCRDLGYHWGGLYDIFPRVSCHCCPLQRIGELRKVRRYFPEIWSWMLERDRRIPNNRGFRGYDTLHDIDTRFADEDKRAAAFRANVRRGEALV